MGSSSTETYNNSRTQAADGDGDVGDELEDDHGQGRRHGEQGGQLPQGLEQEGLWEELEEEL